MAPARGPRAASSGRPWAWPSGSARSPPGPGRALRRRRRVSSAFSILGDKTCRDEVASLPGPTRPAPTLIRSDGLARFRNDAGETGNTATGYPPPPLPARALQARRFGAESGAHDMVYTTKGVDVTV